MGTGILQKICPVEFHLHREKHPTASTGTHSTHILAGRWTGGLCLENVGEVCKVDYSIMGGFCYF